MCDALRQRAMVAARERTYHADLATPGVDRRDRAESGGRYRVEVGGTRDAMPSPYGFALRDIDSDARRTVAVRP